VPRRAAVAPLDVKAQGEYKAERFHQRARLPLSGADLRRHAGHVVGEPVQLAALIGFVPHGA
jgi:hypothetical protein